MAIPDSSFPPSKTPFPGQATLSSPLEQPQPEERASWHATNTRPFKGSPLSPLWKDTLGMCEHPRPHILPGMQGPAGIRESQHFFAVFHGVYVGALQGCQVP